MRVVAGLLIMVLLGSSVPSGTADAPTGLTAALAPVQTVVDEAGAIVGSALFEAFLDGSPDAAIAKRDALHRFVTALDQTWSMPARSTFGSEVLDAIPFADEVFEAASLVPEDAALIAVALSKCITKTGINDEQFADLIRALARLNATRDAYGAAVAHAPPGIDAAPLRLAADQLSVRIDTSRGSTCEVKSDFGETRTLSLDGPEARRVDFFTFNLRPEKTWRGAQVRAYGATSDAGEVQISIDAWNQSRLLPVTFQRFGGSILVPDDAAFGPVKVTALSGGKSVTKVLTIDRAPATLVLSGPPRVREGSEVIILAALTSPAPNKSDNATLYVTGAHDGTFVLAGGLGTYTFLAPRAPRTSTGQTLNTLTATLVVSYAGNDAIAPTNATFSFDIMPVPLLSDEPMATPSLDWTSWVIPAAVGLLAIALAAAMARWINNRRRKRAGLRPAGGHRRPTTAAPEMATTTPAWRLVGIVGAFTLIARRMRAHGALSPSSTARDMANLDGRYAPSQDLVHAFERARYGGHPEDPSWLERTREWARSQWARITGGAA